MDTRARLSSASALSRPLPAILLGLLACLLSGLVRMSLDLVVPGVGLFSLFFAGAVLGTLAAGWLAGATATLAAILFIAWFWMEPVGTFRTERPEDHLSLLMYAVAAGISVLGVELFRRRGARAERAMAGQQQAEAALAASESRFRRLVETLPSALYEFDAQGVLAYVNPEAERLSGKPAAELVGLRYDAPEWGLRDSNDRVPHLADLPISRALKGETVRGAPLQLMGAGGLRRLSTTVLPLPGPEGAVQGVIATAVDVTDLHEAMRRMAGAERLATERAEELAALLDAVPSAICIARDPECRHISGNRAAGRLLRVEPNGNMSKSSPEALPALRHFEVFDADDQPIAPEDLPVQRAARGEVVENFEECMVYDDGTRCHLMVNAIPLPGRDGPRGAVAVFTDISALKQAEAALRERERLFRTLAETISDVFYMRRLADMQVIYMNPAFEQVWGRPVHWVMEAPGRLIETLHPEDRERVRAAPRSREAGPQELVYRILRPDGGVRWIEDRFFPVEGSEGLWVGLAADITARREEEDRRELMLHELNHRARNMLAVVQGIAHQTLAGTAPPPVLEALDTRLRALAQAHGMLTEDSWESADVGGIVRQALEAHAPGPGRAIASGPPVRVGGRATMALTLGLHELATNALKHGAWRNGAGVVEVRWWTAAGQLHLEWRERDGPPVETPSRQGFGTRLIGRSLGRDLGGSVELDYAQDGLVCHIRAALPQPPAMAAAGPEPADQISR